MIAQSREGPWPLTRQRHPIGISRITHRRLLHAHLLRLRLAAMAPTMRSIAARRSLDLHGDAVRVLLLGFVELGWANDPDRTLADRGLIILRLCRYVMQ